MKKLILGFACLLLSVSIKAQETDAMEPTLIDESSTEVPFFMIDEVPVFPECEGIDADGMRDCFQNQMQQHISKHFRYPEEAQKKKIEGRVSIMIMINEEGIIDDIRTKGPDPILEQEARRIFELLPTLKPGIHHGDAVSVPYSIPITFRLQ